jgi:hypothetical protein
LLQVSAAARKAEHPPSTLDVDLLQNAQRRRESRGRGGMYHRVYVPLDTVALAALEAEIVATDVADDQMQALDQATSPRAFPLRQVHDRCAQILNPVP